jgi:uncharacterized protein YjbJ (UPF0337 family)
LGVAAVFCPPPIYKKGDPMVNDHIAKGKWTELKGEIRKLWGQITDDELDETRGDLTKVAGVVQRKYGETQEAIRNKLNSFTGGLNVDPNSERGNEVPAGSKEERLY